ncbi:transporter substrate-binding domain-containing protein [Agrobacterium rubi]|uniref:Transporter substrate-binding domain-containing protein n=1 Tax=Agrobacterium rubi TaxID=28099 RepID=A0AAE7RB54_9HYPH|nr:transporter substrate-binding domain-containing protein [Agrobacterium rubi]NTF38053.1 transporter substrate-binding domain-containing protein [Agrobacterium rubi]OCJ43573.1 ABC transporter substrate-binding protein [Agrobacterium rubi]QTG02031.1 transporter substrate-binding domain-containing protein [Agrobacterium rubi]
MKSKSMKLNRRMLLALAAATVALPFVTPVDAFAGTVEEAKAKGKVVIGIQGDNSPWGFVNSSGVQDGLDADIGKAFADYLGVKAEFVPLAVANRIPALMTGKVDVLFATMGMTAERAKTIQYSQPYAGNVLSVYGPKDKKIAGYNDLSGVPVGVPKSSAMDTAITAGAKGANILRFDDDAANIQALISGQVDVVGGNQFYGDRLNAAAPDKYETKFDLTTLYNGAATRPGEKDWNETINAFLVKIKGDGELAKIYTKWMKREVPAFPESLPDVPFTVK